MKLPAYVRYKPSGVEWLGNVPEHWEVKPLKHLTDFINGAPFKPEDWSRDGVPIIRIENLNGGDNFNRYEGRVQQRYHVTKGDLLFGWSGNRGTSFGPFLWPREGPHYLNQHIFRLAHFTCDRSWFYWALKAVTKTIEDEAHGIIGMVHVTKGKLGAVQIPFLPLAEQRVIATFLDRETGRVDRLVAKKQKLIERLKEKRAALISRTVTRGLPADAARAVGLRVNPPLKPSGIEWLGDIPKHWDARRLKDVGTLKGGTGFPHEEQGLEDEELPFYKVGDLKASLDGRVMTKPEHTISRETARKLRAAIIPPESIIYAKIGAALLLNRRRVTYADCCIDNNMTAYFPDKRRLRSEWAFYWLSILDFGEFMNPGAVPSFSEGYQAVLPVLLPPLLEQAAIAAYLDAETAKLDALVAKVERAVERLQEYRTALITAAVTGKIDVRRAIAQ